jgi:hypothetical protein
VDERYVQWSVGALLGFLAILLLLERDGRTPGEHAAAPPAPSPEEPPAAPPGQSGTEMPAATP